MVFVKKIGDFLIFSFYAKWINKKCFLKARKEKKALLDPKNIGLKNHQNLHFFKGVSPWFLSKNGDFLIFSFYAKWIENKAFLRAAREKKPF